MGAEECKVCPLFRHYQETVIPPEMTLAWTVYRKLARPAVERFGLMRETWAAMRLDLDDEEMEALIDQLNEIELGVGEATKEIDAQKRRNQEHGR